MVYQSIRGELVEPRAGLSLGPSFESLRTHGGTVLGRAQGERE